MGTLTMREAWETPGWGSVAVRGLTRPRVTDAAGECPVCYWPQTDDALMVELYHAWAILMLYRLRYGDDAWLKGVCAFDAIHRATADPSLAGDEAAD